MVGEVGEGWWERWVRDGGRWMVREVDEGWWERWVRDGGRGG